MKIGFISDLHLDIAVNDLKKIEMDMTLNRLINSTLAEIEKAKLDYCIISGDISNQLRLTKEIIKKLNSGNAKVYYTLGNHDLWRRNASIEKELENIKHDPCCLINKTIDLKDNYVLVGMYSWYDSSLETMGNDSEFYELYKMLWIDNRFIKWRAKTNEEVVREQLLQTKEILEKVDENKKIILINHFIPNQDFIIHKPYDSSWNFGNAFMGTKEIKKLVQKDSRIKYVTFGHTHHPFGKVNKDGVHYLSFPLGYLHEWSSNDYQKQFKKSLGEIIL